MKRKDKQVNALTFSLSVLLHLALFMQLSNAEVKDNSKAQAQVYDTRISLNLLKKVEPKKVEQVVVEKPVKVKKKARKKIHKEKIVIPVKHEQAVAPKIDKEIQRKQDNKIISIQQRYLANLLTHIEGHKHYPRAARQRGVEGSIKVSFRLLGNGKIKELITTGGSLVLRRSAKRSVISALPLPPCPVEITCPMQVSYAMQFKLN